MAKMESELEEKKIRALPEKLKVAIQNLKEGESLWVCFGETPNQTDGGDEAYGRTEHD